MAPTSTSDTRRLAVVSINYMFMRFCDADTNQSQSLDADKFYAMQSPALKASYSRTNFDMWRSNDKWSVRSSSTAQPPGGSRGLESEATSMWTWATARVASTRPRTQGSSLNPQSWTGWSGRQALKRLSAEPLKTALSLKHAVNLFTTFQTARGFGRRRGRARAIACPTIGVLVGSFLHSTDCSQRKQPLSDPVDFPSQHFRPCSIDSAHIGPSNLQHSSTR